MLAEVTGVAQTAGSFRLSTGAASPLCATSAQRVVTPPGMVEEALANSTSCAPGLTFAPDSAALPAMDTSGSAPRCTVSVVLVLALRPLSVTVSDTAYTAPPTAPASCTVCVELLPSATGVPSRATHAELLLSSSRAQDQE